MPDIISISKIAPVSIQFAEDDPVGGLEHSVPIKPGQGSSKPLEYWEDELHKKRRPKPRIPPAPATPPRVPQDDHQIDDFA